MSRHEKKQRKRAKRIAELDRQIARARRKRIALARQIATARGWRVLDGGRAKTKESKRP